MTSRIRREPSRRTRDSRGTTAKSAPRTITRSPRSAMPKTISNPAILNSAAGTAERITEVRRQEALLKTGALQNAILNSANFSSIATDAKGVIQIKLNEFMETLDEALECAGHPLINASNALSLA